MMHRFFLLATGLLYPFLSVTVPAGEPNPLATDQARESYSVGFEAVNRLQQQGREPDLAALLRGALDALAATPLLEAADRQALLRALEPTGRAPGVRDELTPMREGHAFLSANTARPGVATLPSGLQYKVLQAGSGRKPRLTDTVVVHYRGSRVDGAEIDSSYSGGKPAVYRLDEVMPGWTEALQRMPEGAEWELYIPARLAFGKRGPLENQILVYRLHLLAVIEGPAAADTP